MPQLENHLHRRATRQFEVAGEDRGRGMFTWRRPADECEGHLLYSREAAACLQPTIDSIRSPVECEDDGSRSILQGECWLFLGSTTHHRTTHAEHGRHGDRHIGIDLLRKFDRDERGLRGRGDDPAGTSKVISSSGRAGQQQCRGTEGNGA